MPDKPTETKLMHRLKELEDHVAALEKDKANLRLAEQHFRALIEQSPDAFIAHDLQGRIHDINSQTCRMTGYDRTELLGMSVLDLTAGLTHEQADGLWQAVLNGRDDAVEITVRRKDGTTFAVEVTMAPFRMHREPLIFGLGRDITARKQVETALKESEAKYRELVDHAPAGIYEVDLERFVFSKVNDVMCEYTGYTQEEFLQKNPYDLLTEESRALLLERTQDLLAGKPVAEPVEYKIKGKNDREFWVLVNSKFFYEAGAPKRAMAVVHDITALKRAEAEKAQLQDQLHQAQKLESLGTLAGGIAHDFNNLLMGIQGNVSLMLMDFQGSETHVAQLKNIEAYVQRGVDLTRQLLGLAQGGKYEVKTTNLNPLIERSAAMFGRTRKDVRIHHRYQEDLWTVDVDRGQIEQVLLNLYVNAWQAMPRGGDLYLATQNAVIADTSGRFPALPPGPYVKITVTDTGIGMDESIQQRIFDPFFTTKQIKRGSGLGLASSYGIVKNHDGVIEVSSRPGEGSTFSVYLPASRKSVEPEKVEAAALVSGREKILLVDDEDMVLDVGRKLLERLEYSVLTADSGAKALRLYAREQTQIDLVILDMIMPEMGGSETFDRLKSLNPAVKVLLSSGYSVDGQASEILRRGCSGFIQKPFNIQKLSKKVRQILARDQGPIIPAAKSTQGD